jgi:hypothetical protein
VPIICGSLIDYYYFYYNYWRYRGLTFAIMFRIVGVAESYYGDLLTLDRQISFGLAFAWGMPYNIIFTFLAIGCCPPGGPANALVLLMGGELETSIIITGLGTVLSVGKLIGLSR